MCLVHLSNLAVLARKVLLVPVRRWLVLTLAGMVEAVFELLLDTFAGIAAAEHFLMRLLVFGIVLVFPGIALAHPSNSLHFSVSFFVFPLRRRLLPLRVCSGGFC